MAGPQVKVELSGHKELLAALNALPDAVEKKVLRFAVREGGKPILAGAKIRAPKKSGNLLKNLKIVAWKRSRAKGRGIGVSVGFVVGGKAFYTQFQEFGWLAGARTGSKKLKQRADRLPADIATIENQLAEENSIGFRKVSGVARLRLQNALARKRAQAKKTTTETNQLVQQDKPRKKIPGKHFIQKSYDEKGQQVADGMEQFIVQGIEREAAKLNKK